LTLLKSYSVQLVGQQNLEQIYNNSSFKGLQ
jgi:hypothetical protein